MTREQLDARNLFCPLPVIRVQDRVKALARGDVLEVVATDPGALNDVSAWCRVNGHEVLESGEAGHEVHIVLRVGGRGAA